MNTTRPSDRRRRARLQPETLETRNLMTSGAGNTFAILNESLTSANQKLVVPFTYQPSLFTLNARHQMTLGIDVATCEVGLDRRAEDRGRRGLTQTHRSIPITRAHLLERPSELPPNPSLGNQTTAVLVTLGLSAARRSRRTTTPSSSSPAAARRGPFLVGFYLPGDAAGTGTVDNSDLTTIKQDKNVNASSANYAFAADSNRDGVINNTDLRIAKQNLGVARP